MNIILSESIDTKGKNAGSKARIDIERILIQIGFYHISLYQGRSKIKITITTIIAMMKTFFLCKRKDYIVVEHPYTPLLFSQFLGAFCLSLKKFKNVSTVIIIHDINSIRYGKIPLKKEIKILNKFSYVICHNNVMKEVLEDAGCTTNILVLGLFDYIIPPDRVDKIIDNSNNSIVIAGNLRKDKCGYIYKISDNYPLKVNLYGIGAEKSKLPSCTRYIGTYTPEELPKALRGKFGLVWDGNSIEGCEGISGNYLKYNNPHKISLYIASGIPVIVWKYSALSKYVIEKNIGISIENLNDIPNAIGQISNENYEVLIENVLNIREEIIRGDHLKTIMGIITGEKHAY